MASSDQGFLLEDFHVLFVSYVQKLADVVDVSAGHCLAVVFLYQEGWVVRLVLSVLMFCSVKDTICLPSAD